MTRTRFGGEVAVLPGLRRSVQRVPGGEYAEGGIVQLTVFEPPLDQASPFYGKTLEQQVKGFAAALQAAEREPH